MILGSDEITYSHDPKCPAYGVPKWEQVTECGPCDWLKLEAR
jgi:hypothetical protein